MHTTLTPSSPQLATRFGRNTFVLRGETPLAEDQMRQAALSIFATGKHGSRYGDERKVRQAVDPHDARRGCSARSRRASGWPVARCLPGWSDCQCAGVDDGRESCRLSGQLGRLQRRAVQAQSEYPPPDLIAEARQCGAAARPGDPPDRRPGASLRQARCRACGRKRRSRARPPRLEHHHGSHFVHDTSKRNGNWLSTSRAMPAVALPATVTST